MKKKKWFIPITIIVSILIVLGTALGIFFAMGYRVSVGVYVEHKNGNPFLVLDNTTIRMDNETNRKLFKDFTIGDRILVISNGIDEGLSIHGIHMFHKDACAVFKLRDGTIEDVPQAMMEHFVKFGWLETEQASQTTTEEAYNVAQYYAPGKDETRKEIYAKAINHKKVSVDDPISTGSFRQLPLFKLDTLAEFEQFKNEFGNPLADPYHLHDRYAEYGEDFFAENTLMLVYVDAPSSAIRYSVVSVESENGTFCIYMKELVEADKVYTDDLASWYFIAEIPDSMLKNCTEFDANVNDIQD